MRVLAKVTLVVNKKEYTPDTEVEIPDDTEAKSLIKRGFASAIGKKENQTATGSKLDTPPETDKKIKSTKSDKNTQKTDNKTKKEIDNSGSAVSQSGG